MKMITIEEGSKDMLPYVVADIEPGLGFWPFQWWYEISSWEEFEIEPDGKKTWGWVHYYKRDGGAFGLWRTMRKAREAVLDVYFELLEEKNTARPTP